MTTVLLYQNTIEKHHNILSHLKTGKAAQGPCDFLCSREGQTLPLQSRRIFAVSLYFHLHNCPCLGDQEEYPRDVVSWSSSMLEPSLCEMGKRFSLKKKRLKITKKIWASCYHSIWKQTCSKYLDQNSSQADRWPSTHTIPGFPGILNPDRASSLDHSKMFFLFTLL